MNILKWSALIAVFTFSGMAIAGDSSSVIMQMTAKRPYAAHVQASEGQSQSANADQAWEGATLQTDVKPDV